MPTTGMGSRQATSARQMACLCHVLTPMYLQVRTSPTGAPLGLPGGMAFMILVVIYININIYTNPDIMCC